MCAAVVPVLHRSSWVSQFQLMLKILPHWGRMVSSTQGILGVRVGENRTCLVIGDSYNVSRQKGMVL